LFLVLLLTDLDVKSVLTMDDALKVVEEGFKEYGLGRILMPVRVSLNIDKVGGWVGVMPVYMWKMEILTTKIVSSYPKNVDLGLPNIMGVLVYLNPKTGEPLALIDANFLTAIRTGAASGVATKYLARKDANIVGLLGSGNQAKTQLEAVYKTRNIEFVKVYSPNLNHRKKFVEEMGEKLGLKIVSVENPKDTVKDSDIVITATNSKKPVLDGRWLKNGVHINSIGAHTPNTRELDNLTLKKSKIIVDSKNAALKETGDLVIPIRKKIISQKSIYAELGEIVLGRKKGRKFPEEITLFKSVGLAFEDAVVAKIVYEKAVKLGIGKEVKLT